MNTNLYAIRTGLSRGWNEFLFGLRIVQESIYYAVVPAIFLVILSFQRDNMVEGSPVPLATLAMPGVLGMLMAYAAMIGGAYSLSNEREDGTLLRAKSVPNGMVGYVTGAVLRVSLETLTTVLFTLIPGLFIIGGLMDGGAAGWLTLVWVFVLGVLATLPLGMAIGAVMPSSRAIGGWGMLFIGGLTAISGIFYPITALVGWVQGLAQVFPVYWLGLGMRSALLPDSASAVEISGSWRHLEMLGVLGLWAVVGLSLAPMVLRRMARRESGSSLALRREKVLQRL